MENPKELWVTAIVRRNGLLRWYRSDVDLWVLDAEAWRQEFLNAGYEVPAFNDKFRFGVKQVNEKTADQFLAGMEGFQISVQELTEELLSRVPTAASWWDVKDLFPVIFVDFDRKTVGAFYSEGVRLERYVPSGWHGEFVDFCMDYSAEVFPRQSKFWLTAGHDWLLELNRRGSSSK